MNACTRLCAANRPHLSLEGSGRGLEFNQGGSEVLDDLPGDDIRGRQVVEILKRVVLEPRDV